MSRYKAKAEQIETHFIGQILASEHRQKARLQMTVADTRRAVQSLQARADNDPLLREIARIEAQQCRRLAGHIAETVRGAA